MSALGWTLDGTDQFLEQLLAGERVFCMRIYCPDDKKMVEDRGLVRR